MCSSQRSCHNGEKDACKCGEHLSRFIESRLLILLKGKPSHGYDLIEKMDEFPFSDISPDPGAVYRTLRNMEQEGLVKSTWETKGTGPAKRIYEITHEGEERLKGWVLSLKKRKRVIEKFIKTYEKERR